MEINIQTLKNNKNINELPQAHFPDRLNFKPWITWKTLNKFPLF